MQPLLTAVVFSVIFGRAGQPSEGTPYPIFTYTALRPWQFSTYALRQTAISLVSHQQLLKKVYFPRLVVPVFCGPVLARGLFNRISRSAGDDVLLRHLPTIAIVTVPLFVLLGDGVFTTLYTFSDSMMIRRSVFVVFGFLGILAVYQLTRRLDEPHAIAGATLMAVLHG